MKGSLQQLSMAVTLASSLAAANTAFATDTTTLAKAAGPSLALLSATVAPGLPPPPPPASDGAPSAADVRRLLTEQLPAPDRSESRGAKEKGPVIADQLLDHLGTLPVLGTVMMPVTRGVMIRTGDGTPPLKLAVIPAQITRGSGFVAIGRF